jgi:hypothetical protein
MNAADLLAFIGGFMVGGMVMLVTLSAVWVGGRDVS